MKKINVKKLAIGGILAILWIAVCSVLILMPKQESYILKFENDLSSRIQHEFYMKDGYFLFSSTEKLTTNTKHIYKFTGEFTDVEGGGKIDFALGESTKSAFGIDVNNEQLTFEGQSEITSCKIYENACVIWINNQYIALRSQQAQEVYCFGTHLKDYKDPSIDVYLQQNEADVKTKIIEQLLKFDNKTLTIGSFFNSKNQITSLKQENENFTPNTLGKQTVTVYYDNDKIVNINVFVYNQQSNPENKILQAQYTTNYFGFDENSSVQDFLNTTQLKIKFKNQQEFTQVSADMIENLKIKREGKQQIEINYGGYKYVLDVFIFNKAEKTAYKLLLPELCYVVENDADAWKQNTFSCVYLDGSQEDNISFTNENVQIVDPDLFGTSDKSRLMTIKYKGATAYVFLKMPEVNN